MHLDVPVCSIGEQRPALFRRDAFRRRDVRVALELEGMLDVQLEDVAVGLRDHVHQSDESVHGRNLPAADVLLHTTVTHRRPVAYVHAGQGVAIRGHLRECDRAVVQAGPVQRRQ